MDAPKPSFKYFRHPHRFAQYSVEPQACVICHQSRPGYRGLFSRSPEVDSVCEECLVAGRLAELDAINNLGPKNLLRRRLQELHPELDETSRETLVQQRTDELEHRTPKPMSWQGIDWPVHCSDYCCFLQEVGKPDLEALAPDHDGRAFFVSHLEEDSRYDNSGEVWDYIRPDSPQDSSVAYSIGVYLFQCLECGAYIILWDQD